MFKKKQKKGKQYLIKYERIISVAMVIALCCCYIVVDGILKPFWTWPVADCARSVCQFYAQILAKLTTIKNNFNNIDSTWFNLLG